MKLKKKMIKEWQKKKLNMSNEMIITCRKQTDTNHET